MAVAITRTCSIDDLKPKLKAIVMNYLHENEPILLCQETTSPPRSGCFDVLFFFLGDIERTTYHANIITTGRIVKAICDDKRHEASTSLLIKSIRKVEPRKNDLLNYYPLDVFSSGDSPDSILFGTTEDRAQFIQVLQQATDGIGVKHSSQSSDVSARLRELQKVYDEGLLDEHEYQRKRSEIISDL